MSDWKIELGREVPLITEVLQAQQVWKRLSKPAQSAVEAAMTRTILVYAHPNTLRALWRHGFTTYDAQAWGVLTDAGRRVAKWNM